MKLLDKVQRAGMDYWRVFGVFPLKIGVYYTRMGEISSQIVFIAPTLPQIAMLEEMPDRIEIKRHICSLEPVAGRDARWDEVYVHLPPDESLMSGESLTRMAERREAWRKERGEW